jgi:hypothetical protein
LSERPLGRRSARTWVRLRGRSVDGFATVLDDPAARAAADAVVVTIELRA